MGPAIRHTTFKLEQSDAKAKILFLVSDGRPQDHGYGRDRTEKEYAIHDTHKALVEAKHKGIVPFALTVDKEGHDYLGVMCGDIALRGAGRHRAAAVAVADAVPAADGVDLTPNRPHPHPSPWRWRGSSAVEVLSARWDANRCPCYPRYPVVAGVQQDEQRL